MTQYFSKEKILNLQNNYNVYRSSSKDTLIRERDLLSTLIAKRIGCMLECTKSQVNKYKKKGRLDVRNLHKVGYTDSVFYQRTNVYHTKTVLAFLIDASGSMGTFIKSPITGERLSRYEYCTVIASAFAKAIREHLNDGVRVVAFNKIDYSNTVYTGNRQGCGLIRTLDTSVSVGEYSGNLDNCLFIGMQDGFGGVGNATPESATLPIFLEWAKESVTDCQDLFVYNLTDGASCGNITMNDGKYVNLSDNVNKEFNEMYLNQIEHLTLFIGTEHRKQKEALLKELKDVYGPFTDVAEDTEFVNIMFNHLTNFIANKLY